MFVKVFISLLLFNVGCNCVVITDVTTESSWTFASVAINPQSNQTKYALRSNITAELIYLENSICQKIELDVANKIVMFQDGQCDYLYAVNNLKEAQAFAGLYFATVFREPGWFLTSDKKISAIDYPLFEMSRQDAFTIIEKIQANSSVTGFTMTNFSATLDSDSNLWQLAFNHGAFWFFWLFFFAIVGFSLAYAMYKFIAIIRIRGVNFRAGSPGSVPQITLVLIMACLLLLWATNIDPFYSRRLYTYQESESVAGFPLPILLVSCIFTATYWLQLTSKFFYAARWVTRYKLVFWLAASAICAIYLILVFLRAYYVLDTAASFIIAFLFEIAVIIFYIVVGVRVIRRLRGQNVTSDARVVSDNKKRVILKVTQAILLCSGGLALHAIAALIFLAVNFSTAFRSPIAQITILYTFPYAMMLTANAQTYAIQIPTSKMSSKSTTGRTGDRSNSVNTSQMTPRGASKM